MALFALPDEVLLIVFSYLHDDEQLQFWYLHFKKTRELMHKCPTFFFSQAYLHEHRYPESIYTRMVAPLKNKTEMNMISIMYTAAKHGYLTLLQSVCGIATEKKQWVIINHGAIFDGLCCAIAYDRVGCVQYLLSVTKYLLDGTVQCAAKNNSIKTMPILLENPKVDVTAAANVEALLDAVEAGNVNIVQMLVEDGRYEITEEIVLAAIDTGKPSIFSAVFPYKQDYVFHEKKHILEWIIRIKNVEMMKTVLEDGQINPSLCKNRTLASAIRQGQGEMIALLMSDARVQPNSNLYTMFLDVTHSDAYTGTDER